MDDYEYEDDSEEEFEEDDDFEEEEATIIYEDENDYMDEEVHQPIPARRMSPTVVFEDEEEQLDVLIPPEITSPLPRVFSEDRVSLAVTNGSRDLQGLVAINDGLVHDSNEGEVNLQQGNLENGNDADVCPICFEAWTSGGNHQVCCLPCGHVYGMSCITKWLQSSRQCPQCKSLCSLKDIIVLYVTRLCVAEKELQKMPSTNFPFTKEGISALQQCAFSLQQQVEAMKLKANYLSSCIKSFEQRCKELTGSEQQSTEH